MHVFSKLKQNAIRSPMDPRQFCTHDPADLEFLTQLIFKSETFTSLPVVFPNTIAIHKMLQNTAFDAAGKEYDDTQVFLHQVFYLFFNSGLYPYKWRIAPRTQHDQLSQDLSSNYEICEFTTTAKAHFECQNKRCKWPWTSKAAVTHMEYRWGEMRYTHFGQKCTRCHSPSYCAPKFYPDQIIKIMLRVYCHISRAHVEFAAGYKPPCWCTEVIPLYCRPNCACRLCRTSKQKPKTLIVDNSNVDVDVETSAVAAAAIKKYRHKRDSCQACAAGRCIVGSVSSDDGGSTSNRSTTAMTDLESEIDALLLVPELVEQPSGPDGATSDVVLPMDKAKRGRA